MHRCVLFFHLREDKVVVNGECGGTACWCRPDWGLKECTKQCTWSLDVFLFHFNAEYLKKKVYFLFYPHAGDNKYMLALIFMSLEK